jgi:hypothetical protein
MAHKNPPLVGVFAEASNADHAIEQLRNAHIGDHAIKRFGKTEGLDISHAANTGLPEEHEPDFRHHGIAADEALYYAQQYEAGYTLVLVFDDDQRQQVADILQQNNAYNFATKWGTARAEEEGAITPAMRGEDSSQTGVAITSEGEVSSPVEQVYPAAVEADMEHVQQVLQEKYRATEARENNQSSR